MDSKQRSNFYHVEITRIIPCSIMKPAQGIDICELDGSQVLNMFDADILSSATTDEDGGCKMLDPGSLTNRRGRLTLSSSWICVIVVCCL